MKYEAESTDMFTVYAIAPSHCLPPTSGLCVTAARSVYVCVCVCVCVCVYVYVCVCLLVYYVCLYGYVSLNMSVCLFVW